jgi:hypothetical protein
MMTDSKFIPGTPQRLIHVALREIGEKIAAFYTYTSPLFGTSYIDAPVCDIKSDRPTYTLYVLDFASTLNGWTIEGMELSDVATGLTWQSGPDNMSIQVFNPYTDSSSVHNFTIIYTNKNYHNGRPVPIDPQEGNIPRVFPEAP